MIKAGGEGDKGANVEKGERKRFGMLCWMRKEWKGARPVV